jgi:hypothetical protein
MPPKRNRNLGLQMGLLALVFAIATSKPARGIQSSDDSQSRPPVSNSDVLIVQRARQILNSPERWNRADNRNCPANEPKVSLYCALEKATDEITHDFAHRGAAMQEARFVIDGDLAPNNHYDHRLMGYNNDPHTTFADIQRFFDLLQGRIEGRLEQEEIGQRVSARPAFANPDSEPVTQTDIEIVKKVESILESQAKWDRTSSQQCSNNARTFGLYCAFEAASISVTGKPDYNGPAIGEVRSLISKTAPNAPRYSARLVDYNNDPTVTFEDLQRLLKQAQTDLQNRLAVQEK